MKNIIEKAIEPFQSHDCCDSCGKSTDGLMCCEYPHDGSQFKLCPSCMEDSGFCLRCGVFSAGIESFDFSDIPGYCIDCVQELREDFGEYDEEDFPDGSLDY